MDSAVTINPQTVAGGENSITTDWTNLQRDRVIEAKVPAILFILCKTVTEDQNGTLFLNGTLVQRILWEGAPPANFKYFPVRLKGPLADGDINERRCETKLMSREIHMCYTTLNLVNAPLDIRPYWHS